MVRRQLLVMAGHWTSFLLDKSSGKHRLCGSQVIIQLLPVHPKRGEVPGVGPLNGCRSVGDEAARRIGQNIQIRVSEQRRWTSALVL